MQSLTLDRLIERTIEFVEAINLATVVGSAVAMLVVLIVWFGTKKLVAVWRRRRDDRNGV